MYLTNAMHYFPTINPLEIVGAFDKELQRYTLACQQGLDCISITIALAPS